MMYGAGWSRRQADAPAVHRIGPAAAVAGVGVLHAIAPGEHAGLCGSFIVHVTGAAWSEASVTLRCRECEQAVGLSAPASG